MSIKCRLPLREFTDNSSMLQREHLHANSGSEGCCSYTILKPFLGDYIWLPRTTFMKRKNKCGATLLTISFYFIFFHHANFCARVSPRRRGNLRTRAFSVFAHSTPSVTQRGRKRILRRFNANLYRRRSIPVARGSAVRFYVAQKYTNTIVHVHSTHASCCALYTLMSARVA